MFIPDPRSWFSTISDPGSRVKNSFFSSHKFHKIVKYFILKMLKKKIWANFQRNIYRTFLTKNLSKSSWKDEFGIRDPRSRIRKKKPIPYPRSGSRGRKGTRSRIRNTAKFSEIYSRSCFFTHLGSRIQGSKRFWSLNNMTILKFLVLWSSWDSAPGSTPKILEQKIQYLNLDDEIKCLLQIF